MQLPKHHLKSKIFQDVCFHTAVEQLALHFAQWCNHIAFPDLATISLIRLRKVYEITTIESSRRMLRRLIEQVLILALQLVQLTVLSSDAIYT